MAKEVKSTNEPSQSSFALPPLAENEVELVIERFWRDTRPRVCVRSEAKMVNGFNFRLLVWPQGSKQSQSHLSAFVEVVPPSGTEESAGRKQYPPDWACPGVFYRISVMNFKQKYPYSKADTWTFSYVCPDRGWHTLLDTRYINRRDGYLSNDGALVIRAIAFPRFGHSISVLPLLSNVAHTDASSSFPIGLANYLATDHVNSLVQSLFHLPGFRRMIYKMRPKDSQPIPSLATAALTETELDTIAQGLDSCAETVREIMTRVANAAPEVCRMIFAEFSRDSKSCHLCSCHKGHGVRPVLSRGQRLAVLYGRCRILVNCLEESLFSVSQSLFGRKRSVGSELSAKRIQFDAYRQIVKDCRRILATVAHSLFVIGGAGAGSGATAAGLIGELQSIFAQLELGENATSGQVIDTRGVLKAIGVNGLVSPASPDGLFSAFFEALKKSAAVMVVDDVSAEEAVADWFTGAQEDDDEHTLFSHVRLSSCKATSVEKHVALWAAESGVKRIPKILTIQFTGKIKDRLDVSEVLSVDLPAAGGVAEPSLASPVVSSESVSWEEFLDHECGLDSAGDLSESNGPSAPSGSYKLHGITFCSGEGQTGHYSAVVRHHRAGGWSRFDDAWSEELIDVGGASGIGSGPDWVFSPEWSCSSVTFVRNDAVDEVYARGVDVRLIRPDLYSAAVAAATVAITDPLLCNRQVPSIPSAPSSSIDPTCQVEVSLITEKDVLAAVPGGYSVPFSFAVPNATRKLIVRKDIVVERLMQAVNDHFRIPVAMQRLLALRYYPETGQERFELMQRERSVLAYLEDHRGSRAKSIKSTLYVLVSASRATTVWVKVFDEKALALVSVCLMGVDPTQSLRDAFAAVAAKAKAKGVSGISDTTQFLVFEEVGPRQIELRRTSVAVKAERIMDGDVLIFVPLTESAKRSLIGTAALPMRPKRRLLTERVADGSSSSSEDDDVVVDDDELATNPDLNERCRKFLSRVNEDEECDDARLEIVRKYLRKTDKGLPKLADIMNDIMHEFDDKRRLDVPADLKEELARTPVVSCFFCQLPIGCSRSVTVSCTAGCSKSPLVYHERCVQELVSETASTACVITDACRGRILADPKAAIAKLIKEEPKLSSAALRARLVQVLARPSPPSVRGGVVVGSNGTVISGFGGKGAAPPLPAGVKKKPNMLPVEPLWWNACLTAFGGFDELHGVVVDQQWDAADLAQARAVYVYWCKLLLDKQVKPVKSAPVVAKQCAKVEVSQAEEAVGDSESQSEAESESRSSDADVESEHSSESEAESSEALARFLEDNSDDDGFILVGKKTVREEESSTTPTTGVPTLTANSPTTPKNIVIPSGLFEASAVARDDSGDDDSDLLVKAVSELLDVSDETVQLTKTESPAISLVESLGLGPTCSLLESRLSLLPADAKRYCLPVELVFVYYSEQFFTSHQATTVSVIPVGAETEDVIDWITGTAFNSSLVISRIFTSPHQAVAAAPITVQWFVDFASVRDAQRFAEFVVSACPEWGPETGGLLPASMLGFAV